MPNKFLQTHALLVLVIVAILIGTAGVSFFLRPALEVFRVARIAAAKVAEEYETAARRLKDIEQFSEGVRATSPADIEKLRAFFLASPEMSYGVTALYERARSARFLLTSLEISSAVGRGASTGALRPLAIQAQLKGGGYQDLKVLLNELGSTVPLFDLASFTFDPRSTTVSLNLKAQSFSPESAQGPLVPVDQAFLNDPRFKALNSADPLPSVAPVGRENPFDPFPVEAPGVTASSTEEAVSFSE